MSSSYKLSYFPRSDLRKQRKRLTDLPDSTDAFFGWGEDGTGNQRC